MSQLSLGFQAFYIYIYIYIYQFSLLTHIFLSIFYYRDKRLAKYYHNMAQDFTQNTGWSKSLCALDDYNTESYK